MPITQNTPLNALPALLPGAIATYNAPGTRTASYNATYNAFMNARLAGVAAHGNIHGWIVHGGASAIHALLTAFGMSVRTSALVPVPVLAHTLVSLPAVSINWIQGLALPLNHPPCSLVNPSTGQNFAAEMSFLFNALSAPGAVTMSGGFVAASKALHCLFPNLAPMIDGRHSGTSYFHILRATYTPPLGISNWNAWLGAPLVGVVNPSPAGAGRSHWDASRFLAALGVNQHIYEMWQIQNRSVGFPQFMALDPAAGTTGIPRIIDKLLW